MAHFKRLRRPFRATNKHLIKNILHLRGGPAPFAAWLTSAAARGRLSPAIRAISAAGAARPECCAASARAGRRASGARQARSSAAKCFAGISSPLFTPESSSIDCQISFGDSPVAAASFVTCWLSVLCSAGCIRAVGRRALLRLRNIQLRVLQQRQHARAARRKAGSARCAQTAGGYNRSPPGGCCRRSEARSVAITRRWVRSAPGRAAG